MKSTKGCHEPSAWNGSTRPSLGMLGPSRIPRPLNDLSTKNHCSRAVALGEPGRVSIWLRFREPKEEDTGQVEGSAFADLPGCAEGRPLGGYESPASGGWGGHSQP